MGSIISITNGAIYRASRTQEEIDEEVSRLVKVSGIIHARGPVITDAQIQSAIAAQILVLRERMTAGEVYYFWDGDENETYIVSEALTGVEWLDGEAPAPSAVWLDMVGDEERVH